MKDLAFANDELLGLGWKEERMPDLNDGSTILSLDNADDLDGRCAIAWFSDVAVAVIERVLRPVGLRQA